MTERKTAEIKFRVRPSDKARWQQEAALAEITLSELIEKAVAAYVAPTIISSEQWVSGGHERFEMPVVPIRDDEHPAAIADAEVFPAGRANVFAPPPPEDVPTDEDVEYPWMFCG